jgi:hypothetical protein
MHGAAWVLLPVVLVLARSELLNLSDTHRPTDWPHPYGPLPLARSGWMIDYLHPRDQVSWRGGGGREVSCSPV